MLLRLRGTFCGYWGRGLEKRTVVVLQSPQTLTSKSIYSVESYKSTSKISRVYIFVFISIIITVI